MKLTKQPSPITAQLVAQSSATITDVQSNGHELFFRYTENGRSVVRNLQKAVTAPEKNVRSAVHEYGGGSFVPTSNGIVFTDFATHLVYYQAFDSEEPTQFWSAQTSTKCRFAEFQVFREDPELVLVAVMEDHTDEKNVVNSIVKLTSEGVEYLARGNDFYSSPSLGDDQLAYVTWSHPNMPWDDTQLCLQKLDENCNVIGEPAVIVKKASVYSPQFYENKLYFISNTTGWYNLYRCDEYKCVPLWPKSADFSESKSGWSLGTKCYTFLSKGVLAATYVDHNEGSKIVLINIKGAIQVQEYGRSNLPSTSISSLCAVGNQLYFLGGTPSVPQALWFWTTPGDFTCIAKESFSPSNIEDLASLQQFMSKPELLECQSPDNGGTGKTFAYFYPPANLSDDLPEDFKPPLLVKAHGGPTARTSTTFRLDIHFWTSRGFAVVDVDYGGSTGYGEEYQRSLYGKWGSLDVADVKATALHLVEKGLVNKKWLCIDGRSAGGFTTLAALTFTDVFKAGASLYGIGDLYALASDTHKFESRYMDKLIAPLEANKSLYDSRCPIMHIEQLNCPCIFLQGDEDKVVPVNQAESMYKSLLEKGVTTSIVVYQKEQHGFRITFNIRHALLSEYHFFCHVFGFDTDSTLDGTMDGFIKLNDRVNVSS